MNPFIIVRGAGDIATGTLITLRRCGYRVAALEAARPTAIRRSVALSEAVYDGAATVEGVAAALAADVTGAERIAARGDVPILIDPDMETLGAFRCRALIDATLAKKNRGMRIDLAAFTIGLGPGFTAGADVHRVIETMRGHNLGRVIDQGGAEPNTGIPGEVGGAGAARVIHVPADGVLTVLKDIGDRVAVGEVIAEIDGAGGKTPVRAQIGGLLRGMLRPGFAVKAGLKLADIDPRLSERENCFTVSDKARCIAGGVLQALLEAGILP